MKTKSLMIVGMLAVMVAGIPAQAEMAIYLAKKPNVKEIEKGAGFDVTAAMRDEAWDVFKLSPAVALHVADHFDVARVARAVTGGDPDAVADAETLESYADDLMSIFYTQLPSGELEANVGQLPKVDESDESAPQEQKSLGDDDDIPVIADTSASDQPKGPVPDQGKEQAAIESEEPEPGTEAVIAVKTVIVTARNCQKRFRAGMAFTKEPTVIALSDISDEKLGALQADQYLSVETAYAVTEEV